MDGFATETFEVGTQKIGINLIISNCMVFADKLLRFIRGSTIERTEIWQPLVENI
jgi:hypothetical protein